MGRCRVLCDLDIWVSGLVADWLDFCFYRTVLVPSGWILGPAGTVFGSPGLHSESVVSLWGEPAAPVVRQIDKLDKVEKRHDLGCQLGVFWDTF